MCSSITGKRSAYNRIIMLVLPLILLNGPTLICVSSIRSANEKVEEDSENVLSPPRRTSSSNSKSVLINYFFDFLINPWYSFVYDFQLRVDS